MTKREMTREWNRGRKWFKSMSPTSQELFKRERWEDGFCWSHWGFGWDGPSDAFVMGATGMSNPAESNIGFGF